MILNSLFNLLRPGYLQSQIVILEKPHTAA